MSESPRPVPGGSFFNYLHQQRQRVVRRRQGPGDAVELLVVNAAGELVPRPGTH